MVARVASEYPVLSVGLTLNNGCREFSGDEIIAHRYREKDRDETTDDDDDDVWCARDREIQQQAACSDAATSTN